MLVELDQHQANMRSAGNPSKPQNVKCGGGGCRQQACFASCQRLSVTRRQHAVSTLFTVSYLWTWSGLGSYYAITAGLDC